MPSRPSAPSSLASSRGNSPRSNQVATSGCTRSSTKRRVVSWTRRSSSLRWPEIPRKSSALALSSFMRCRPVRRGALRPSIPRLPRRQPDCGRGGRLAAVVPAPRLPRRQPGRGRGGRLAAVVPAPRLPRRQPGRGGGTLLVGHHGGGDELDLGGGVEQAGHLEEGHGGVVAAEVAPPGGAQLAEGGPPRGRGGHEDLHADQVL